MRTVRLPLPPIVVCVGGCRSEFSKTQTGCPDVGSACPLCKRGVIEAPKGFREVFGVMPIQPGEDLPEVAIRRSRDTW